jgi:ACS family hexuronate transporter-like MFS transporter
MMKRLKGLRWWIVGLICLGTIINYLARNSLAVLAPVLQTKLSFSTQEYSYVVAAFQVGYTVMQSVCGYILDFLGLKLGSALFAVLWSGANLLHALAGGWGSLAFFRGLLGLSEAAAIPAGIKAISEWFPAKERSVAVGYFNAGTSLGALLAPPLVIWVLVQSSWQMAFIVTGGLGFIFALLWWLFYRTPRNHWLLGDWERDYILAGQESKTKSEGRKPPPVLEIISSARFWGIAIPRFLAEPAWQTFNFWIPLYLANERHMNLKEINDLLWRSHWDYAPIVRPSFLDFPDDERCYEENDDMLVGANLLVAAVVEPGQLARDVYLPMGCGWYDFWTGAYFSGAVKRLFYLPPGITRRYWSKRDAPFR